MIKVMIKVMIIIKGGPGLGPGPPLIMIMTLIMTLIMINNTSVLALRRGLRRVFVLQKKRSKNIIIRIYKKRIHLCVFPRKLIKYAPSPPTHHPGSPPSQVAF